MWNGGATLAEIMAEFSISKPAAAKARATIGLAPRTDFSARPIVARVVREKPVVVAKPRGFDTAVVDQLRAACAVHTSWSDVADAVGMTRVQAANAGRVRGLAPVEPIKRAPVRQAEPDVEAWIAANGVTRCPAAMAAWGTATISPDDRAALAAHAAARQQSISWKQQSHAKFAGRAKS
jgi:hypothetical protein